MHTTLTWAPGYATQRARACTCDSLEDKIALNIADFIQGQYGVVAVLVSYGALLGKVPLYIYIYIYIYDIYIYIY
jgi:hypothetical protein